MTKTLEQLTPTTFEQDREEFLDNNERGFESPENKERTEALNRKRARIAFASIAHQIESGHNID
jgi:hypothetical protein